MYSVRSVVTTYKGTTSKIIRPLHEPYISVHYTNYKLYVHYTNHKLYVHYTNQNYTFIIRTQIIRSLHEPYIIRRRGGDAPSQPITPFTCNVIKPLLPHYKGFVMALPSSCNQPKGLSSQTKRAAITSQKAIAIPQPICHYNIEGWHIWHFKEPK